VKRLKQIMNVPQNTMNWIQCILIIGVYFFQIIKANVNDIPKMKEDIKLKVNKEEFDSKMCQKASIDMLTEIAKTKVDKEKYELDMLKLTNLIEKSTRRTDKVLGAQERSMKYNDSAYNSAINKYNIAASKYDTIVTKYSENKKVGNVILSY